MPTMTKKSAAVYLASIVLFSFGAITGIYIVLLYPATPKRLSSWWIGAEFLGTEGVLLQSSRNDCGPTALAMVMERLGIPAEQKNLIRLANLNRDGTTMLVLKEIATKMGLQAEGRRLTFSELERIPLPAIALVRRNHFIVIDRIDPEGKVQVSDPSIGRLQYSSLGFQKVWYGETLLFFPQGHKTIHPSFHPRLLPSVDRSFIKKGGDGV